ncbi:MAG: phosphoglycerate kinase [Candidatus Pacebacteria bacterium]|nr:phosphoglycerate kinase [Candidatus Paceibacterota bacterium]
MKTIRKIKNLKNKKVLVRVDFNVPVRDDGIVDEKEDWRIRAALPMIEYLLEKEAKIILISHLGRPDANRKFILDTTVDSRLHRNDNIAKYSLKPVADRLEGLLNREIKFIDDCIGDGAKRAVEEMRAGEIVLLENLRFYKEEKENNEEFAKELAGLADIYVNNAFSVSHRKHASVHAITKFLPSYAGLLLEKEVEILSKAINNPKKPATIIVGGAKMKTKVPVIEYLIDKFDHILVGGIVANVILKAKGIDTGKSLIDGIDIKEVRKIDLASNKLYVPVDAAVCNSQKKEVDLRAVGKIGDNKILDIGPETGKLYSKIIRDSKTVIWNGPMGMFEKEDFAFGTREIAEAVVKSKGYTIIGGGDTIAALDQFGCIGNVDYVCTGGGAMLEFLAGKKLPGLEALE